MGFETTPLKAHLFGYGTGAFECQVELGRKMRSWTSDNLVQSGAAVITSLPAQIVALEAEQVA